MFSSTLRPLNRVLIWKVRTRPRLTRSCSASPAMSRPSSRTEPAGRRQGPGQQVDEGRLARAVRPDHGMARAGFERKIDVPRDDQGAEILAQPLRFQNGGFQNGGFENGGPWRPLPEAADQRVEHAEQAARREQDRDDECDADHQLPIGRIGAEHGLGQVLQDREHRDADEGAVEPARAAQDQHDEDVARHLELVDADRDVALDLDPDGAGDPGDHRRDDIDMAHALLHRRADGVHAPDILADADQRAAERRIDDGAGDEEAEDRGRRTRTSSCCCNRERRTGTGRGSRRSRN